MPNLNAVPPDAFTYTLHELASRDEIVFKSVLRVLQGKTRHAWQHTDTGNADLVVRGSTQQTPMAATSDFSHSHPMPHPDITVSTSRGQACRVLAWPLRIADVIACLDQAGDEIASLARRALQGQAGPASASGTSSPSLPAEAPSTPASAFTAQAVTAQVALPLTRRMVLTRWPGPALLQRDMRYIKLATVLTGQPVNLLELAARTGFDLHVCRDFTDALRAESLVRLLDGAPQITAPAPSPHRQDAQPGLIARIRLRLEMIVRTPAAK